MSQAPAGPSVSIPPSKAVPKKPAATKKASAAKGKEKLSLSELCNHVKVFFRLLLFLTGITLSGISKCLED